MRELIVESPSYISLYTLLLIFLLIVYLVACFVFVFGSLRASRAIHKHLISSVLGTTLRYVCFLIHRLLPTIDL